MHIQRQKVLSGPWEELSGVSCVRHRADGRHEGRGIGNPLEPEDCGRLSEMAFGETGLCSLRRVDVEG